ncbi:MAG: hypothetical protein M1819_001367, partial [Sarea resinae]
MRLINESWEVAVRPGFIQRFKENCKDLLGGKYRKKREKEKLVQNIEVDKGELNSRFDKVHGSDGLVETLLLSTAAMIELRIFLEYGDYLAVSLESLRRPTFSSSMWRLHPELNWQEVNTRLEAEEAMLTTYHKSQPHPIIAVRRDTPWLTDVYKAAQQLNIESSDLRHEIQAYAQRNSLCYNSIETLINKCDFSALGRKLLKDKAALDSIFQRSPHEQITVRN